MRPPIVAMGMSYGAATAIEWAGRDPRVEAAVAVAPFSSLREVVPVYVPRFVPAIGRLVPGWLVQRTVDRAGRLGGFDPDAASPLATIARARRVLIVHGRADDFVPLAQSESLAAPRPIASACSRSTARPTRRSPATRAGGRRCSPSSTSRAERRGNYRRSRR
ncbi:MAG TPA: hypothetical protein VE987_15115 [Polyangiaceae bacterium]|nr:hypothetical protein [Polyangiaceae bacterium]